MEGMSQNFSCRSLFVTEINVKIIFHFCLSIFVSKLNIQFSLNDQDASFWCCRGIYQTIPVYGASENINRRFSEGTQMVEYKVVDEAGNFARCSFHVTITGSSSICTCLCTPLWTDFYLNNVFASPPPKKKNLSGV